MNQRIKKAREDKGMTQAQLASEVGCTEMSIYNWETKSIRPMPPYLAKLEEILGIQLKEVENEESNKDPASII